MKKDKIDPVPDAVPEGEKSKLIEVTNDQALMLFYGLINLRENKPIPSPLAQLRASKEVPPKISYWSVRITSELEKIVRAHAEVKGKILDKYRLKDKDDKPIMAGIEKEQFGENIGKMQEELDTLIAEKNTLPFNRIVIDLETFPVGVLSGNDIMGLDGVICDFIGA
jgi:hypothetical protein